MRIVDALHVFCLMKDKVFNILLPTQASSVGAGGQVLVLELALVLSLSPYNNKKTLHSHL